MVSLCALGSMVALVVLSALFGTAVGTGGCVGMMVVGFALSTDGEPRHRHYELDRAISRMLSSVPGL